MNLNEIRSLLEDHGFTPKEIGSSDIEYVSNLIGGYNFPESLVDFIKVTNGCNFGILKNIVISCDVINSGSYEPYCHPISKCEILKMFDYRKEVRKRDDNSFLYEYTRAKDLYSSGMSLPPDRYFPLFNGFLGTKVFIDMTNGSLVNFNEDGEDPKEERTIVASSIDDFIERSIIEPM